MNLFKKTSGIFLALALAISSACPFPVWGKVPLNYMQAHSLRLSSARDFGEWFFPGISFPTRGRVQSPQLLVDRLILTGSPELMRLVRSLESKDQRRLEDTVDRHYGDPILGQAKFSVTLVRGNYEQSFSSNMGALLLAENPVFPRITGFIHSDLQTTGRWSWTKAYPQLTLKFIPQIALGRRKIIREHFTVGELFERKIPLSPGKVNSHTFVEYSHLAAITLPYGVIFQKLSSLPLIAGHEYSFWENRMGLQTPLLPTFMRPLAWQAYFSLAPFYGGSYNLKRTLQMGLEGRWQDQWSLHFFMQDVLLPGGELRLSFRNFQLSLLYYQQSMDEKKLYQFHQYALQGVLAF